MATATMPARTDSTGLRLFTVEEYDAMLRVGILREGEPFELLGGQICKKMPKSAEHMAATTLTLHALYRVLPPGRHAVQEHAVIISDYDEPEPDVTVRRGDLPDYNHRKATAEDIALLVEVAVTSLETDRGKKLRAYAAAGIPTYWIINLNRRCIEVYTAPRGGDTDGAGYTYAHREERTASDQVDVVIAGVVVGQINVAAIVPEPPAEGG
jgi:Uma2 family endonuclease